MLRAALIVFALVGLVVFRAHLANALRGLVRCLFPVATVFLWAVLLNIGQGQDVLRAVVERWYEERSVNDLAFLLVATLALALSIWYSMRWLLAAPLPALPMPGGMGPLREWTPRLFGAAAPLIAGAALYQVGGEGPMVALAFFLEGVIVIVVLALRPKILKRAAGRTAQGAPRRMQPGERLPRTTFHVLGWALALSFALGGIFTLFELSAPRVVGAAAIFAFALASINLSGSFLLTYWPMSHGLPPFAPWLVVYALALGLVNDNHGPHLVAQAAPATGDARLTPRAAFESWSAGLHDGEPVYIVATEGGGMRAAFWTAATLQMLEEKLPDFRRHLFAISAVSGGSVGAATWVATKHAEACLSDQALVGGKTSALQATGILAVDLLSPVAAGLTYYDFAQRFIPVPFPALDRSRGLEEGLARAAWRLPGHPLDKTIDAFYETCTQLPELLMNSTVVENGGRAILTRLDTRQFVDTYSLGARDSTRGQTVAALAHHSARFPLISPAGTVLVSEDRDAAGPPWSKPLLHLVDGGYFDNSGVETAIELLDQITKGAAPEACGACATAKVAPTLPPKPVPKLTPVLILIANEPRVDAACKPLSAPRATSSSAPLSPCAPPPGKLTVSPKLAGLIAPLVALFEVRDSHVRIVTTEAHDRFSGWVVVIQPPPYGDQPKPPLGWALSDSTRRIAEEYARTALSSGELSRLLSLSANQQAR